MVIAPRASNPFRILVVRDDVVVVREVFVANGAYPAMLDNLSVQKLPHLGRGPQFPISSRVMRIFDASELPLLRAGAWESSPGRSRRAICELGITLGNEAA